MSGITCREFDELVHGFVRMELLDVGLREAALEHAACCSNCAERMAEAGLLAEATEAVAKSVHEQQAPPSVEAALVAAFRSQRRRRVWWRTFEWATAGAAAAMLVVALWTFSGRSKGQAPVAPRKDVFSQSKAPLEATGPKSSKPEEVNQEAEVSITTVSSSAGVDGAGDFVPVPFTEAIGPEESGMVVRVQLTRASLAELGYPVDEVYGSDWIRADVLVGQDGWPRGVRLVQ